MKFLIQRVESASVTVEGSVTGEIQKGFLVFVGVTNEDTTEIADRMVKKMLGLRIFEDEEGKTNRSLADVEGSLLIVSQFTLYADCKKGNRPSFIKAGNPEHAKKLYQYIVEHTKKSAHVQTGIFGAAMKISLINDGPFTVILDSEELF
ncbi:MAG: D-tyrosyl-tRNA(Tyr) deacylase [Lachnospiraceae bacterium]|jgi:D-tyrosyl-tRNA(Tyr) deacylase|nr:D-tyrosyl-tRNA(Tyr) deacylase [Lachnospiraceae bacterium]